MLPNSAIKSIVRCSGEGCEAALYGGGVGSSASVGGSDKYCWVNPAVSRRDTSVTVELKPCEEVMKGLLVPAHNTLHSSSSSPSSSPAFAMLMHEALNEASLSVSLAPRVPKSSFPTACICSVTAAVAPKSDSSSSSPTMMKDVVIREWMLLESRTAANHFATQISVRTLRNINSLVNGDEDDDNDHRRSTSRDSTLSASSPHRDFFSSNARPPPRMFLTLRFVGCCDNSDRHEISSLALGYVFSSVGKEMLAEAAKLVGGSYYPQLTPPHPSKSSRQSPLSSRGGGEGRAGSSRSHRGEDDGQKEMRDQDNWGNEEGDAAIRGKGQRQQHALHLLTAPSSVDVSQTQTAASDRSTQLFTVHHQQQEGRSHRSPISSSPFYAQHRGGSRHHQDNSAASHQQKEVMTFSPDARSPHPSFSSSPSFSRGYSNNENSNTNKLTNSGGGGTREGTTRDIEINGGGVGTSRGTAPSISTTRRPPLSGLQTNRIGASFSSVAPIREERGGEGGAEEVLAHMLFNSGTNNNKATANSWRHTQDEATTTRTFAPSSPRNGSSSEDMLHRDDAKDNNNTSTNTKPSAPTIRNTNSSSTSGPTTLLGTWQGGIVTDALGDEGQTSAGFAHANKKKVVEEDGERGRAGSDSSRDVLSAPTAHSGRLTMGLSTAAPSPTSSLHRDSSQPQLQQEASREGSIALNRQHYAYAAGIAPVASPLPHPHSREGSPFLYTAYDPRDVYMLMTGGRSPVPTLPSLEALGVSPPAAPSPPANHYKYAPANHHKYEHDDRRRTAPQVVGGGEEGWSLRPSPSVARSHASREYSPPVQNEGYYRYGNMHGVTASSAAAGVGVSSTPQLLMTLSPPPPLAGSPSFGPIHNRGGGGGMPSRPHTYNTNPTNVATPTHANGGSISNNQKGGGGGLSPSPLSGRRERAPAAAAVVVTKRDASGNFIISTLLEAEEEEAEEEEKAAVHGDNNNKSPPHRHAESHSSPSIPPSIPTRAYVVGSGWGELPAAHTATANELSSPSQMLASVGPFHIDGERPRHNTANSASLYSPSSVVSLLGTVHTTYTSRSQQGATKENEDQKGALSLTRSERLLNDKHIGVTPSPRSDDSYGSFQMERSSRVHVSSSSSSPQSGSPHRSSRRRAAVRDVGCSPLSAHYYLHSLSTNDQDHQNHTQSNGKGEEESDREKTPALQPSRALLVSMMGTSPMSSASSASEHDVDADEISSSLDMSSVGNDRRHQQLQRRQQSHTRRGLQQKGEHTGERAQAITEGLSASRSLARGSSAFSSYSAKTVEEEEKDRLPFGDHLSASSHHSATSAGLPLHPSSEGVIAPPRGGHGRRREGGGGGVGAIEVGGASMSRPPPRRSVSSSSVMPDLSQFVAVNKGCAVTIGGKEFAVNVRSGNSNINNSNTNSVINASRRVNDGLDFTSSSSPTNYAGDNIADNGGNIEEMMRGAIPPPPLLSSYQIYPRHPLGYEAMAMEQAKVLQTAKAASVDVLAGAEAYSPEEDTLWLAAELLSRDTNKSDTYAKVNNSARSRRSASLLVESSLRGSISSSSTHHRTSNGGNISNDTTNDTNNNKTNSTQQQQRSHSVPNTSSSRNASHTQAHAHHYYHSSSLSSSSPDFFSSSPHDRDDSFSPRFRAPPKTSFVAVRTSSSNQKSTTTECSGVAAPDANDDKVDNVYYNTQVGAAVFINGEYVASSSASLRERSAATVDKRISRSRGHSSSSTTLLYPAEEVEVVGLAANTQQQQPHSHPTTYDHRPRHISWHEEDTNVIRVHNVVGGNSEEDGALEGPFYHDDATNDTDERRREEVHVNAAYSTTSAERAGATSHHHQHHLYSNRDPPPRPPRDAAKSSPLIIVSPALPAPPPRPSSPSRRDFQRGDLGGLPSDHGRTDVGVAIEINGSLLVERERQHNPSSTVNNSGTCVLYDGSHHAGSANGHAVDGKDKGLAANLQPSTRKEYEGGDDENNTNNAWSISSKGHSYRRDVAGSFSSVVSVAEQTADVNGNGTGDGYCVGIGAEEDTTDRLRTSQTEPMGRQGSFPFPHERAAIADSTSTCGTSRNRAEEKELLSHEEDISGSGAARQESKSRGDATADVEDEDEDEDDVPPPSSPPPKQGSLAFSSGSNTEKPQSVLFEGPQSVHTMSRLADQQLSRWKAQNGPNRASQATLPARPTGAPVEGEKQVKEGDPVMGFTTEDEKSAQAPYEVSVWCLKHHARTAGTARRILDFRKCEDTPSRTLVEAYGVEALAPRVLMCMRHVDGRMWKEGGNGNTVRAEVRSSSSSAGGGKGRSRSGSMRSLIGAVASIIGGDDEEKREDGNPFVELSENTVVLIGQRALEDSAIHREYVRDPRRCVVVRQSLAEDQTRWANGIADDEEEKGENDHRHSLETNRKGTSFRRAAPKAKTLDEQYTEHRSRSRSVGASVSTSYERVVAAFELTSEADWLAVVSILKPFIPISSFL